MNRMAKEAINPKAALHELPPLIKGYLRLAQLSQLEGKGEQNQ
jgi:putative hemolysin